MNYKISHEQEFTCTKFLVKYHTRSRLVDSGWLQVKIGSESDRENHWGPKRKTNEISHCY